MSPFRDNRLFVAQDVDCFPFKARNKGVVSGKVIKGFFKRIAEKAVAPGNDKTVFRMVDTGKGR